MSADELVRRLGLPSILPHLEEALTHPSYSNEQRGARRGDNQRLEFLGDAVLGLCVSEVLMERFPAAREGELSLMRASLVNTDALATWARSAGVGAALRLGRGADAGGERQQKNVLADAVEALVGAVYLDCGIDWARKVSQVIVAEPLERMASGPPLGRDPKSELQERVQAEGGPSPRYRIVGVEGPDHNRQFVAVVEVGSDVMGTGAGRSKKLAEQEAARAALRGTEHRAARESEPPDAGSTHTDDVAALTEAPSARSGAPSVPSSAHSAPPTTPSPAAAPESAPPRSDRSSHPGDPS